MAEEEKKKRVKRPTALKRQLQDEKKRLVNKQLKSRIGSATRSFDESVKGTDGESKKKNLSIVHSLLDRALKKKIFSRNKVNRIKSKFAARAK